jgi:hypothetical protein
MRLSTALLADTSVRLADLDFPHERVLLHRTRLAFIYLDKLLHFAKADRDGQVDGFIAVYLPTEVTLLVLRRGELATVISYMEEGRQVRSIPSALAHFKREAERGEIIYCAAPLEQLAWMCGGCATSAARRPLDLDHPERLLLDLMAEEFTGVLELISNGRVNYLRFDGGVFQKGYLHDPLDGLTVQQYVERLFEAGENEAFPEVAAWVLPAADELPEQSSPELIQTYREAFWAIAEAAEAEVPRKAMKRVERIRDLQANVQQALKVIGAPRDEDPADLVTTPQELMFALSDWTLTLLEELEVIAPGAAPTVLKEGTREHRFILQKAGFYDRLPWTVSW